MPDVAATLATLGTDERAWGRAWHVPSNAAALAAAGARRPRRRPWASPAGPVSGIPWPVLRAVGVVVPMMREVVAIRHQFDQEFVIDVERDDPDVRADRHPVGRGAWPPPRRPRPWPAEPASRRHLPWAPWFLPGPWSPWRRSPRSGAPTPPSGWPAGRRGRGDERRPDRAAGAGHRRRPQRPGRQRGTAVGAAAARRVARRGPGGRRRRGPPVRPVDPVQPRRARVPRLRVAHLAAERRRRDRRPRRPGVRVLAAARDGTTSSCSSPARTAWWRSTSAPARTTTSWELTTDVLARTPDAPEVTPRGAAVRDRRRRAHVRDRPCRRPTSRCGHHVRPTREDPMSTTPRPARHPRQVADRYVDAICDLDPLVATSLGTRPGDDRLPDLSPAGLEAEAALDPRDPGRAGPRAGGGPVAGRRPDRAPLRPAAARAARRRAGRARGRRGAPRADQPVQPGALDPPDLQPDAGRDRGGLGRHRPPDGARARRPTAASGRRLEEGGRQRAVRGPAPGEHRRRPARRVAGRPVLRRLRRRPAPRRCGRSCVAAARAADGAVAEIRDYLRDVYAPARPRGRRTPSAASGTRWPPAAGPARTSARAGAGGGLRLGLGRAPADPGRAARSRPTRSCPVRTPMEAMRWLGTNGPAVEGVEAIRERLQEMMDDAIAALDGTHFDLAEPVRRVEAMIAPPGSAAAPYYTRPGAGLLPAGPHLAADARAHPLPALGPGVDLVPRGRPGPSPAAGAVGLRLPAAVDLPDLAGLGRRQRRGLGAVRRAADGRARLLHRPRRAAGLPGRAAAARRCGWSSTSACTWGCRSRTTRRAAGRAPRAAVDAGAGAGVPRRELRRRPRLPRQRAGPLPRHARAGDQLQARRAGLAGRAARPRAQAAGRGLRPQGLAHGRAVTGLAGPGRPGGRAGRRCRRGGG